MEIVDPKCSFRNLSDEPNGVKKTQKGKEKHADYNIH